MDPKYIESRPIVDMNSCVPGQKLITNRGTVLTYVGLLDSTEYPHEVEYDNGAIGSRTNEGWTYRNNPLYTDEDVVYIVPVDGIVR